jgi:hypothetical protein
MGGTGQWHRDRDSTRGQQEGLLVQGGIDRIESRAMEGEDLVQGFSQVLHEMKAVGNLDSCRSALLCALGVGFRPIPGDHLHARMLLEPVGEGLGCTIGQ